MNSLNHITVDLTPTLPGGANGGVRLLAIHLIQTLAQLHPECQFTLLTADISHDELAMLDAPNVRRKCALHIAHAVSAAQSGSISLKSRVRSGIQAVLPQSAYIRLKSVWAGLRSSANKQSAAPAEKSDLLFCPYGAPTYARADTPTVSIIVDLQYQTYPEYFSADEVSYRDLHFRQACEKASQLVCISDYVRQTVMRSAKLPAGRATTIHITLPQRVQALPERAAQSILSKWRLVADEFLFYPANFWRHKNHEMLLEAFALFRQSNAASILKLVCSGHPDARSAQVQAKAATLGLTESVIFPGYVSDEEFAALLQSSRAVIFPSLYEGFGMPVLEAMAFGKPVACSNVTSLPEVAGDAAIFFDPRNAGEIAAVISQINDDSMLLNTLANKGRQQAAALGNAQQMAQKYWHVFVQTAARHKENS